MALQDKYAKVVPQSKLAKKECCPWPRVDKGKAQPSKLTEGNIVKDQQITP